MIGTGLAPPTSAGTDRIEVSASAPTVDLGEAVTIGGSLVAAASCLEGRALQLGWRPADSGAFATVALGATAADGAFAFDQVQRYTGWYQVTAPPTGPCEQVVSEQVRVRVRAHVESTLFAGPLTAGSCVEITVQVSPPKPGQTVELQRRTDGAWRTVAELALDDASEASARPCLGWEDVGIVRLRAVWPMQDPLNARGIGPALGFGIELAGWMEKISSLVGGRLVSVSVGEAGRSLFGIAPDVPRAPASNEKLLLSMALLDAFGPRFRMRTLVATDGEPERVLHGDLWILGRGDPEVDRGTMRILARRIAATGIRRVEGRVIGSTTYFSRDWDAPGWDEDARAYVARPTALTFEGNRDRLWRNVSDPEARAAAALDRALERRGVSVRGRPDSGSPPTALTTVATISGRPLRALLARMLRPSDNFIAEVLGKRLGVATSGSPGTIAKGAAAITDWAERSGVTVEAYDASGLSYADRVTAEGLVRLLGMAETAAWGPALFAALPSGGQGTLRHRLATVRVRAKTGTLSGISALSGWVWLERLGSWGEFSILSRGMSKSAASELEDRIVRILQNHAR